MGAENDRQLDPRTALDRARRVEDSVRRRGRWHGWVWLVLGLITPVFLIGVYADALPGETSFWIAVGFGVAGASLAIWETRRGLWGREAARANRSVTWGYMAAMGAAALLAISFDPSGLPVWWVVFSLVPSVPCFVGAWRVLTG